MDTSLALAFNHVAIHFKSVLPLFSDWMVYIVALSAAAWVAFHHLGRLKAMIIDGIYTLVLPIGLSVVISEGLSKIFNRSRPFVADKEIQLLVPHNADGGFPSHHMTVMAAIAIALWYRNRNLGAALMALTILSGIARIGAGIHYPTDILAGLVIGALTSITIHRFTKTSRARALRSR
jgi:membrane-associated phospholipid phosphatase